MKSITLPSGAKLDITVCNFAVSRSMYQAVMKELKDLKLNPKDNIDVNLFKDIFCVGVSSKQIEECVWECMKRATYNGKKIDENTFEPVEAREDYIMACFEVAKENIEPFMKSLYAQYIPILEKLVTALA